MNYIPVKKDDFDKSFKYKKQSFLCYSGRKLKELSPEKDYTIVGLARKSDKDTKDKLVLGNNLMAVFEADKSSAAYKTIGYIPVDGENSYIAIQDSMIPFALYLTSMAAATAIICLLIAAKTPAPEITSPSADGRPVIQAQLEENGTAGDDTMFNPLPPVDTNIEDLNDAILISNKESQQIETKNAGGKVTISYKPEAKLDLTKKTVTMEYQNPSSSSHDAVLSLYVVSGGREYLLATSGRIPAGKQLKTMHLTADEKLFSAEGKYNAMYRISYYDPKTGEKALAEANVNDISLTVRK